MENTLYDNFTELSECQIRCVLQCEVDGTDMFLRKGNPQQPITTRQEQSRDYLDFAVINFSTFLFQTPTIDMAIHNCHYNWFASGNNKKVLHIFFFFPFFLIFKILNFFFFAE